MLFSILLNELLGPFSRNYGCIFYIIVHVAFLTQCVWGLHILTPLLLQKVGFQKIVVQYRLSKASKLYQLCQETASLLIKERTAVFQCHLSS